MQQGIITQITEDFMLVKTEDMTIEKVKLQDVHAVVSININPSIDLLLDEDYRVMEIKTFSDASEDVVSDQLIGMTLQEAVTQLSLMPRRQTLSIKRTVF